MNGFTPEIKNVHFVRMRDGSRITFYKVNGQRRCVIRQSRKLREYLDAKVAEAVRGNEK